MLVQGLLCTTIVPEETRDPTPSGNGRVSFGSFTRKQLVGGTSGIQRDSRFPGFPRRQGDNAHPHLFRHYLPSLFIFVSFFPGHPYHVVSARTRSHLDPEMVNGTSRGLVRFLLPFRLLVRASTRTLRLSCSRAFSAALALYLAELFPQHRQSFAFSLALNADNEHIVQARACGRQFTSRSRSGQHESAPNSLPERGTLRSLARRSLSCLPVLVPRSETARSR